MNNNKPLTKMDGNYKVAIVQFLNDAGQPLPNSPSVEYACYDQSIVPGNIIVGMSAHHGMVIGHVKAIEMPKGQPIYREIIDKVDTTAWYRRIDTRAQREDLIKQMQRRAEELKEISLYETLAKADPKMADLFKEFSILSGGASTDEGKND